MRAVMDGECVVLLAPSFAPSTAIAVGPVARSIATLHECRLIHHYCTNARWTRRSRDTGEKKEVSSRI